MDRKNCPDCGEEKPLSEFGKNRTTSDGLQVYCRACCARRGAEIYRRRRARLGKIVRVRVDVPEGHKYCPGCQQVKPVAEWHRHAQQSGGLASYCKDCRREQGRRDHLKRKFGLTPEALAELIDSQGGTCAICDGRPQHIDHDHATGKVRGVLCGRCNLGLGQFADDRQRLASAIRYLLRNDETLRSDVVESPIELSLTDYLARHRSASSM